MKPLRLAALLVVVLSLNTAFAQKGTILVRELESVTIDGDPSDWPLDNFEAVLELPDAPEGLEAESLDLQGDHLVYNIDKVGFFGGADVEWMTDGGAGDFEATTYFAHDAEFFYLLSVVTDDMIRGDKDPSAEGNQGFRNDGIEFFFDAAGDNGEGGDCTADGATFQDQEPNRDDMQITAAISDSFLPADAAENQLGARHGIERAGNPLLINAEGGEKNGPGGVLRDALDALDGPNIAATKTDDGYVIELRVPFGFIPEFSPDNVMRYTQFWNDADTDEGPGNAAVSRINWAQQTKTRCTDDDEVPEGLFHTGTWAAMTFVTDNPLTPVPGPNISLRTKASFGQFDTTPAVQEITIPVRNTGTTNALSIESVTVGGANADRFTVVSFPNSLEAKASGDIVVSFDSQGVPGEYEAVLNVANNDTDTDDKARQVTLSLSAVNLSGPLAHYSLDEADGTVMNDVTGFGRHGVYDDVSLGQEGLATGTSAGFEGGSEASVPVSALGDPPARFSIGAWFNGDTFEGQQKTLFGQGLAGSPGYALLATGTELQWFVGDAPEFTGGPIAAGTTHHAVITYGPDKATIYLDGVEVGSMESPLELDVAVDDTFYIGSYAKALPFSGRIDDVQFYDRVLSAEDVATLFNNPGTVLGSPRDGPDPEPQPAGPWMTAHDFEDLDAGPLDGVGGWVSADPGTTIASEDDGNKVLASSGPGQNAYASLGGTIPSGSKGTVFFRARASGMTDFVLGASDVAEPDAWDHFEGYMRFSGTKIDVRDGGGFTPAVENFSVDTWYNIWLVLDNDALETTLYYSTGEEPAQLGATGAFRMTDGNTEHGDIINFLVRTGNAHEGTGQLDDIHLASGENLTLPGARWSITADFEGLDVGTVNGQGSWTSTTPDITLVVSNEGNQALAVEGGGQNAYVPLPSAIPSGATGTVYFRARLGEMPNFVLGVSDVADPDTWDHFEGYMRFAETNLDVRDGGGFATGFENVSVDTWYNIWLVLDNDALETTLYYSEGQDAAQLGGKGAFRMTDGNTEHGDLITFLIRTGNTHVTGQVDDIHVDANGENLTIPQSVLDGLGGGGMTGEGTSEITGVSRSTSGLSLAFPEGASYDIEYSVDLITWDTIATNVAGAYEDTDAARAGASNGFYRGVVK